MRFSSMFIVNWSLSYALGRQMIWEVMIWCEVGKIDNEV